MPCLYGKLDGKHTTPGWPIPHAGGLSSLKRCLLTHFPTIRNEVFMLNNRYFNAPVAQGSSFTRRFAGLSLALLGLTLAGCGLAPTCSNVDQPYLEATAVSSLKVPGGLDAPARTGGLNIPAAPAPAAAPAGAAEPAASRPAGKCLDEPPSYFGGAITPSSTPEEVVAVWAEAWSARNTDRMMAIYSQRFEAPSGTDSAAWLEQRREQVATGPVPEAGVLGLKVTQPAIDRRLVTFAQRFDNNSIRRELTLARENSVWRIITERVIDLE
jgi:hypothetical protein